jgi:hypothetical protein
MNVARRIQAANEAAIMLKEQVRGVVAHGLVICHHSACELLRTAVLCSCWHLTCNIPPLDTHHASLLAFGCCLSACTGESGARHKAVALCGAEPGRCAIHAMLPLDTLHAHLCLRVCLSIRLSAVTVKAGARHRAVAVCGAEPGRQHCYLPAPRAQQGSSKPAQVQPLALIGELN